MTINCPFTCTDTSGMYPIIGALDPSAVKIVIVHFCNGGSLFLFCSYHAWYIQLVAAPVSITICVGVVCPIWAVIVIGGGVFLG